MTTGLYKKGLVLAVICLFIGACVVPSISGNIEQIQDKNNSDFVGVASILSNDQLDQFQIIWNMGIAVGPPDLLAQSFKPSENTLTRVELLVNKIGTPTDNLLISIRSSLDGPDITSISLPPKEIPTDRDWIEFDFEDVLVNINQTYYIVFTPLGTGMVYLWWGYDNHNFDSYTNGESWLYTSGEWSTEDLVIKDWCFKTYRYAENQAEIVIDSIEGGFRSSAVIKNNGTATATDVNWSIDLEGGLILAGSHTEGVIDNLAPGASKTIRQSTLYGIGNTVITVTAGDATKQATGFILGPLVLGVKEIS